MNEDNHIDNNSSNLWMNYIESQMWAEMRRMREAEIWNNHYRRVEDNPLYNMINGISSIQYDEDNQSYTYTIPEGIITRSNYEKMNVEEYTDIVNMNNIHFPF